MFIVRKSLIGAGDTGCPCSPTGHILADSNLPNAELGLATATPCVCQPQALVAARRHISGLGTGPWNRWDRRSPCSSPPDKPGLLLQQNILPSQRAKSAKHSASNYVALIRRVYPWDPMKASALLFAALHLPVTLAVIISDDWSAWCQMWALWSPRERNYAVRRHIGYQQRAVMAEAISRITVHVGPKRAAHIARSGRMLQVRSHSTGFREYANLLTFPVIVLLLCAFLTTTMLLGQNLCVFHLWCVLFVFSHLLSQS